MSFLSNARRALGGKPTDDEYDNYDNYDDEYEDGDGYADDEYEDERPQKSFFSFLSKRSAHDNHDDRSEDDYDRNERYRDTRSSSYSGRSSSYSKSYSSYSSDRGRYSSGSGSQTAGGIEVTVLYPENFDKCNQIVQDVKAGKITIFDVSGIETVDEARRIVDYICGAAEGMECPFSRLCPSIFCIAPKGVTVTNPKQKFR